MSNLISSCFKNYLINRFVRELLIKFIEKGKDLNIKILLQIKEIIKILDKNYIKYILLIISTSFC